MSTYIKDIYTRDTYIKNTYIKNAFIGDISANSTYIVNICISSTIAMSIKKYIYNYLKSWKLDNIALD